jgi:hypothetical protein
MVATMPPKKLQKTEAQKHELEAFAEKYDTLALIHGDPVEVVFAVMQATEDDDTKLRAADMLMSYRYPRVKAMEGAQNKAPVLNFNVTMPSIPPPQEVEIQSKVIEMPRLPPKRTK